MCIRDRSKLAATDDPCGCRLLAGGILLGLADAVAYENQTYYHHGLKAQLGDLGTMSRLPDRFLDGYLSVVGSRTVSQIKDACETLIATTGEWLDCAITVADDPDEPDAGMPPPQAIDFRQLAEDYGETISTFNKVYSACSSGNAALAFISAVCLQEPLSDVFPGIDLDVLSAYDAADLRRYADHVRDVEAELVTYIEGGAPITRYASVDEFLRKN